MSDRASDQRLTAVRPLRLRVQGQGHAPWRQAYVSRRSNNARRRYTATAPAGSAERMVRANQRREYQRRQPVLNETDEIDALMSRSAVAPT
jgi:hypothetical protein